MSQNQSYGAHVPAHLYDYYTSLVLDAGGEIVEDFCTSRAAEDICWWSNRPTGRGLVRRIAFRLYGSDAERDEICERIALKIAEKEGFLARDLYDRLREEEYERRLKNGWPPHRMRP